MYTRASINTQSTAEPDGNVSINFSFVDAKMKGFYSFSKFIPRATYQRLSHAAQVQVRAIKSHTVNFINIWSYD